MEIGSNPLADIGKLPSRKLGIICWWQPLWETLYHQETYAGKDGRWEEKGATEDKMIGCYHQLNGYEFEQTLGDGEGQGILACCSPRGPYELDTT